VVAAVQVVDAIRPPDREFVERQRRDLLARFGLTGDISLKPVGSLSGGERNRVGLARLAAMEPNFLILDEPTNHLDLWARDALEKAILRFDGTVLFVSHDRYFLNHVADHLLVAQDGRFRVIEGNYDFYSHLGKEGLIDGGEEAGSSHHERASREPPSRGQLSTPRPKRRFPYRKVAEIEREILERETALEQLQRQLVSPEVLRSGQQVKEVQQRVKEQRDALAALYAHWEEAVELN
jgi:ATP-binding cassette subfamily F protein 3